MKTLTSLVVALLLFGCSGLLVGCATGSRKSSSVKVAKAAKKMAVKPAPVALPAEVKAAEAPAPASPIAEFFARLAETRSGTEVNLSEIPFDYFTSPEALSYIGKLKTKDIEVHRAVALALPRAADEVAFAAAAALAELEPNDPEIIAAVADVLEQAMLDRGFEKEPARLKYARDLLHVLALRPEPDAAIEGLVLEIVDDGTQADLQKDAFDILKSWKKLDGATQLTILARARDARYTATTREELTSLLKRIDKPDDTLVLATLEVFLNNDDSVAREDALALLVTWKPSDQAVVAKLAEAGIEYSAGGREPASTGN